MSAAAIPGWVDDLVDALDDEFDAGAVTRGHGYAEQGRVQQLVADREGSTLLGTVRGSGRSVYQTIIRVQPGDGYHGFESRCSCPLGGDCKHAVAVLLEASRRRGAGAARPTPAPWEHLFAPLTSTIAPDPSTIEAGLLLEWPGGGTLPAPGDSVELRPVRRGASGRWLKSDMSWASLRYARGLSPAMRSAYVAMAEAADSSSRRTYYAGAERVRLGDFGSAAGRLLRDALRAGIALVAPDPQRRVVLADGPATPGVDLSRTADGGVRLRPTWSWGGSSWGATAVRVLGDPPAVLLSEDGADLVLVSAATVEVAVVPVLRAGDVVVPPADAERFLSNYHPLLARRVAVTSSDGSCPPPQVPKPRLHLEARYSARHQLALTWQFAYGDGAARAVFPLREQTPEAVPDEPGRPYRSRWASSGPTATLPAALSRPAASTRPMAGPRTAAESPYDAAAHALRDLDEERRLVGEAVAIIEPHLPGTIWPRGPRGHPQPYSPSGLGGMQTAVFTTSVLPILQSHDGMEVRLVGKPADYRYVDAAPVVRVGIGESRATTRVGAAGAGAAGGSTTRGSAADGSTVGGATAGGRTELRSVATDDGRGGTDWFDLDIRVELDGEEVPFRPLFAALAAEEEHLLLGSGAWFDLRRHELAQLKALIDEARALSDRDGPLRISRWQAGLWADLADVGVVEEQCESWTRSVAGLLDAAAVDQVPVPETLRATLRPYQVDGYRWLTYLWEHRLGGILADDMGLGKTMQALAAILRARDESNLRAREGAVETTTAIPVPPLPPVLVVAPTSVIGTWLDEAATFAPDLAVDAVTETAARRRRTLDEVRDGADVVVTSYALLRIEADDYRARPWSAVLLDEAQFVKNPRGKTHQVVRALNAPVKVAMTGTPLENSLMDLWALLAITAPGLFPAPEVFTELYRRPIESGSDPEALARLQRRLRPLMLRRTKDVVAPELPPKQEQVQRITLAPAHRRLYDKHLQRERQRVLGLLADFDRNRIAIFRSLTVLRQLALAPILVDPDGPGAKIPATKVEAFAEQIAEVAAEGHRALVFSQFTGFLALVRERLDRDGIGYAYLDGRTRDRPARIASWRTGDQPVFLISLKAGGFGLTLTEADYVFVLDPWWNPAAEAQAVDRTHRIGQDKTVMVYRLIAEGTIEEKVLALQERKRDLFARVIDKGGALDSMLTIDDIRGLLDG